MKGDGVTQMLLRDEVELETKIDEALSKSSSRDVAWFLALHSNEKERIIEQLPRANGDQDTW